MFLNESMKMCAVCGIFFSRILFLVLVCAVFVILYDFLSLALLHVAVSSPQPCFLFSVIHTICGFLGELFSHLWDGVNHSNVSFVERQKFIQNEEKKTSYFYHLFETLLN